MLTQIPPDSLKVLTRGRGSGWCRISASGTPVPAPLSDQMATITRVSASPSTEIDYNKIRNMLGLVVTDGEHQYVVVDFKMGCEVYELWCKTRKAVYYTGPNALHQLFEVISG